MMMTSKQVDLLCKIAEKHGTSFGEVFTEMQITLNKAGISIYDFLDYLLPM